MPSAMRPEMLLALVVIQRQLHERFQELTGMSLDEWDEMNYRRVMF